MKTEKVSHESTPTLTIPTELSVIHARRRRRFQTDASSNLTRTPTMNDGEEVSSHLQIRVNYNMSFTDIPKILKDEQKVAKYWTFFSLTLQRESLNLCSLFWILFHFVEHWRQNSEFISAANNQQCTWYFHESSVFKILCLRLAFGKVTALRDDFYVPNKVNLVSVSSLCLNTDLQWQ